MKKLFFIIAFFICFSLFSAEILILKPILKGKIPYSLKKIPDPALEIQKLTRFYIHYFYKFSFIKRHQYLISDISSEKEFQKICLASDTNFILIDEIFFDESLFITRNLFNCNLSKIEKRKYSFQKDLFFSLKEVNRSSFLGLYKRKKRMKSFEKNKKNTLYVILQASLSFQKEITQVINFIEKSSFSTQVKILLIEDKKYRLIHYQRQKINFNFENFLKKPKADQLFEALYRLKPFLQKNDQIVIITNAKVENLNQNYISHFSSFQNASVFLVLGNYYNRKSYNLHKSFMNQVNVEKYDIAYYRFVILPKAKFYLITKGIKIYKTETIQKNFDFFENLKSSDLYLYKSNLQNISPLNFLYHYEKITGNKIITAGDLENNLELILNKILENNFGKSNLIYKYKNLIKTNQSVFWFYSNKKYEKGIFVRLQTAYINSQSLDKTLKNIPEKTKSYDLPVPHLLVCQPEKIRRYFKNTNEKIFECILQGQILESKSK